MKTRKILGKVLIAALVITLLSPLAGAVNAQAKSAPKLSTKKVFLTKKGEKKTVTVSGLTKKQKKKLNLSYKQSPYNESDDKVVKAKKSSNKITIEAVADGTASIGVEIGNDQYTCDVEVCLENDNPSYATVRKYIFNDSSSNPLGSQIGKGSGSGEVYLASQDDTTALVYVDKGTTGTAVVMNGIKKTTPSYGIAVLQTNDSTSTSLLNSYLSEDESKASESLEALGKQTGLDNADSLSDIDMTRLSPILSQLRITCAGAPAFDSSSYVKGSQITGFMGFVTDIDSQHTQDLSTEAQKALDAEDAALKAQFGFGLKDFSYNGF